MGYQDFFLCACFYRNAWTALGEMPKEQAMRNFIDGVQKQIPELKPYHEAYKSAAEAAAAASEKNGQNGKDPAQTVNG